IESIGVERSKKMMNEADVVVYLFDVASTTGEVAAELDLLNAAGVRYLAIGNKTDALGFEAATLKFAEHRGAPMLFISAREKENIQALKQMLFDIAVEGNLKTEGTIITNARHHASLAQVLQSLQDIRHGMQTGLPGDLLSLDIRRALHFLGEITGEVTTEDKLDYIFSKFCIGK
ncbi:MAG: tRNA uridine-5-carboxymethylaminomethyl(34) synthesis GTPase MnmE, partial [Chitinophagaceae bacterium]